MTSVGPVNRRQECEFCSLYELCWPAGATAAELERRHAIVGHSDALPAGKDLFRTDDPFTAIYAVRAGCVKTYSVDADGRELVHGFHLRGELLGFDAVFPDRHRCNAKMTAKSSVCVVPYRDIVQLSYKSARVHGHVLRLFSREFSRQLMIAEGSGGMQRIARFLLDMHARSSAPVASVHEFRLQMSREDIANYLGIAAETLSRLLAKLQQEDLIEVKRRRVRLTDPEHLHLVANGLI